MKNSRIIHFSLSPSLPRKNRCLFFSSDRTLTEDIRRVKLFRRPSLIDSNRSMRSIYGMGAWIVEHCGRIDPPVLAFSLFRAAMAPLRGGHHREFFGRKENDAERNGIPVRGPFVKGKPMEVADGIWLGLFLFRILRVEFVAFRRKNRNRHGYRFHCTCYYGRTLAFMGYKKKRLTEQR